MLTPKQAAFAGFVASGVSYTDAYEKAYDVKSAKPESIRVLASRLMKVEKVRKAVDDLKADKKEAKRAHETLTSQWILDRLKSEAMDETNPPSTRVRALELLGKSHGVFEENNKVIVEHRNPEDIEKELGERLKSLFSEA